MTRLTALLTAALLCAAPLSAVAKDKPKSDLPGVDGDYRIVKPKPDYPEPQEANKDGFVRYGDTWIKVSGMVRYDVDYVGRNGKR